MTQTQVERTRSFSWSDPATNANMIGKTSGLSLLRSVVAGELPPPPVMELLGITGMTVEEGRITVEMPPREFHYNPLGSVHGGVLATLLDTAAGCAVHSTLPPGMGYTSLDLSVKYLRPATVGSELLICVGTVIQRGRRVALAEARLTDAAGRLVAHATSSCLLLEMPAS